MNLARTTARAARPALGLFLLACAAAAGSLAFPGAAHAQDYPRLGLYGAIGGDGYPYFSGDLMSGALQDTTLDAVARYHEVILDASPLSEYRKDVLTALRARRPDIRLLAYVTGETIWNPSSTDSLVHYPTLYYRMVRDLGGWLYNSWGGQYSSIRVNLAKRDLLGHFVVAEAIADLFYDAVLMNTTLSPTPPSWDGIFIDIYCKSILWTETPYEHIDFVRAGYPTLAAFDAAWGVAADTLGNRLRRRAGAAVVMVGNCAQSTNYGTFNGWMRENFPLQNGGDWYQNMFRNVGGYLPDDVHFRPPASNYLFSAMAGSDPYFATNTRKVRFGLGSAALGGGYGVFGPSDKNARRSPYHMYWYDEYAVDLATGRSSSSLQHTGWLGQPLGPYTQMIWLGSGQDAVTNPDFETDVTSGWSFTHSIPASISRDAGTAAVGSASAHVNVPAAGNDWAVVLGTAGTLAVSAYQPYSATFWAKASVPRAITLAAGMFAATRIPITTEWRRYQVTLVPIDPGTAGLQFYLAEAAGDVWLDDVHFQPGVSNLYRRDFQNGIVLVNPAAQTMTVSLERDFKKILGTRDVITNDGSIVTQATIFPSDALFLIGDDRIAPDPVMDLQPGPAWTPRTTRVKRATPSAAGQRP
jgi:hypothetical protein